MNYICILLDWRFPCKPIGSYSSSILCRTLKEMVSDGELRFSYLKMLQVLSYKQTQPQNFPGPLQQWLLPQQVDFLYLHGHISGNIVFPY